MRDASGLSYVVDMYETALRVGGFTVPKVYAVADRQNGEMILGRDVLNYFVVTLNGLAQTTEISD